MQQPQPEQHFLSALLGTSVTTAEGTILGKTQDLVVDLDLAEPEVMRLVFRKRFSAELGLPPLSYLQFLKMERAKMLLRSGLNVRQTGIEIGMHDPYHFSKQFKQVVGMAPTAYLKHVGWNNSKD